MTGAHVIYHDAAGNVVTTATTGNDGASRHRLTGPGMVTVIGAPNTRLARAAVQTRYTFVGVEPGDELVVGNQPSPPGATGRLTVQLPGAVETASAYVVDLGCVRETADRADDLVRVRFSSACFAGDGTLSILAVAVGPEGEPLAYSTLRDVRINERGHAHAEVPAWHTDWHAVTIRLQTPPAQSLIGGVRLAQIANGVAFEGPAAITDLRGAPTDLPFHLARFGDELRVTVVASFGLEGTIQGMAMSEQSFDGELDGISLDLGDLLLPRIPGVVLSTKDLERPRVVWTADGGLSNTNGAMLLLSWYDPNGLEVGEQLWAILLPPEIGGRFQLPALPDELSSYRPSGESVHGSPMLAFFEFDSVNGYDQLRTEFGYSMLSGESLPPRMKRTRLTLGGDALQMIPAR